jgi:hypothetical protein
MTYRDYAERDRSDDRATIGASDREHYATATEARERAAEINMPGVIHDAPNAIDRHARDIAATHGPAAAEGYRTAATASYRAAQPIVAAITAPDPDPDGASPAPLPVFNLPPTAAQQIAAQIPAPPRKPSQQTPHQMRANLLGMHATAHAMRRDGKAASLKRQLAKIAVREEQFSTAAGPNMYDIYKADRDGEQQQRDRREANARIIEASSAQATAPQPPPPPPPPAPEPPPTPPPTAAARRPGHSRTHYNNDPEMAEYPNGKLTDLDRAVEDLVRAHGNCAVIDASWAAAHRLFKPNRPVA